MKKVLVLLSILLSFTFSNINSQNYWKHLEGPIGGNIQYMAYGSGYIFATITEVGIAVSSDGGNNWYITDHGFNGKIFTALLKTTYHGGILAAESGNIYWIYINNLGELETNEWDLIKSFSPYKVFCLAVDDSGRFYAGTSKGIYRAVSLSANWTKLNNELSNNTVNKILMDSNGNVFAASGNKLYHSIDYGNSFAESDSGLGNTNITSIIKGKNGLLLASSYSGIFCSTNNGVNWEQKDNSLNNVLVDDVLYDSENSYYAATYCKGILKSTDNGESWIQLDSSLNVYQINSLVIDNSANIFAGTSWGIFSTNDGSNQWAFKSKGLNNTKIIPLVISNNDVIYTLTAGGLICSTDDGETWEQKNNGFTNLVGGNCLAIKSQDTLFAGFAYNNGLFRSTDKGSSWHHLNCELDSANIENLAINSKGIIFAATGSGLYRSFDNGDNWINIFPEKFFNIFLIKSNDDIIAGESDGRLYLSSDNGDNWNLITNDTSPSMLFTLEANSKGDLFAGNMGNGLYRSTDMGKSWQQLKIGFSDTWVRDIAIDKNDKIFIATKSGVYYSFDNGDSWNDINLGLDHKDVFSLKLNSKGELFAGTYDGGIYSRTITDVDAVRFLFKVGNRWDYVEGVFDGSGPDKTQITSYTVIADTLMPNGKLYYLVRPYDNIFFKDYIRSDSKGIYYYDVNCGQEWLCYNFELSPGEHSEIPAGNCDSLDISRISKGNQYNETYFGKDVPVMGYAYNGGIDIYYSVEISPEFGFLKSETPGFYGLNYSILKGCQLSGVVYGELTSVNEDIDSKPKLYSLSQNYPNPFNPVTTINYQLPKDGQVTLKVYDILGREIKTLVNEFKKAGYYKAAFNASNLASGIYIYELRVNEFKSVKKLTLLK